MITSDGLGYYDYLVSIFIENDLARFNAKSENIADSRFSTELSSAYVSIDKAIVNKYTVGVALLQSPFFSVAYALRKFHDQKITGYERDFQNAIYYSALFYLLLGLIAFKQLLTLFNVRDYLNVIAQILILFATPLVHYAGVDSSYSHVYSFFAVSVFLLVIRKLSLHGTRSLIAAAIGLLGLIFIIRQANVIVLVLVPFIAGSYKALNQIYLTIRIDKRWLVAGLLVASVFIGLQSMLWFLQTGKWIIYSYQGEGFNFTDPKFFEALISFRKGLFVYTPVLFCAVISTSVLARHRDFFAFFFWWMGFLFLNFIISSWWAWDYGSSFGMRPFVDFYSFLILPLILFLNKLSGLWSITYATIIAMVFIPLNLIQAYQYEHYILHWNEMDKEKYWKVFLHTEKEYEGLVWNQDRDFSDYQERWGEDLGSFSIIQNEKVQIIDRSIPANVIENANSRIKIQFMNEFRSDSKARIQFVIYDSIGNAVHYSRTTPIIRYAEREFGDYQKGSYSYPLGDLGSLNLPRIRIFLIARDSATEFEEVKVSLIVPNQ